MDETRGQTPGGRTMRWWLVLPWVIGGFAHVGRVWAHASGSAAWDAVSPFGLAFLGTGLVMHWHGPRTDRSRRAARLIVAAGALVWFLDVNADRVDPGQPHATAWFLLSTALFLGVAGCLAVAIRAVQAEWGLWRRSGLFGRPA